ncbi:MAG TPA: hypothetical protein PKG59_15700 [Spirochaetota bacterium]|nr:hypothetical protein [Spirochaetota bacterium]HOS41738.1 hypothetical protein [Spirochaetota bacterium]
MGIMDGNSRIEEIQDVIRAVAADLGYLIYESAVYLKGENSKLSVKIDHLGGISHSDCEAYSRALSQRLDDEALLPNYMLEISSPGLTRKIRSLDEFIRFTGSKAKVVFERAGKRESQTGIIAAVTGDEIELREGEGVIVIRYGEVVRANLDF